MSCSLEERVAGSAAVGLEGFEVFGPYFVASPWSPQELRTRAADLGLTLDLYQPFRDFDTVDEAQFARNLVRVQRQFELMAQLGCETFRSEERRVGTEWVCTCSSRASAYHKKKKKV